MTAPDVFFRDEIPGGKHWSLVMKRGTVMRLTDIDGGANVGMLFHNPLNLLERYNAPDTLKCQHTFKLTAGNCLYSDMGRIFCSIVADTMGWHDTVCGTTTKAMVAKKWGAASYQQARNDWTQNGRDAFLVEAAKYGLGRRDIAANVNWFSKVEVAEDGALQFVPGASKAGDQVDLRFEMDTLVLLHTCPHPLDPASAYPRKRIAYEVRNAPPVASDDLCLTSRPENARGFENNRRYLIHACC